MHPAPPGLRHGDISWRLLSKLVAAAALLLLVVLGAKALAPLGAQVVIASFLAIAIHTVVRWLEGRGLRRGPAVLLVFVGLGVVGLVVSWKVTGPLLDSLEALAAAAPEVAREVQAFAERLGIGDRVLTAVRDALAALPGAVLDSVLRVVGGVFGLVNMTLMVIFLVLSGDRVLRYAIRLWPRLGGSRPLHVVDGAYHTVGQYLLGATAQALMASVSLGLLLWLLGTPYVLALALLMFLLDYVPLVGATLASIPAVAVTLATQGVAPALVMTLFLIAYQQVENAIIQPRIQGRAVSLPAIAVFFSVMVGGQLFGVGGALLAVPVASIIAIAIESWLAQRDAPQVAPAEAV